MGHFSRDDDKQIASNDAVEKPKVEQAEPRLAAVAPWYTFFAEAELTQLQSLWADRHE